MATYPKGALVKKEINFILLSTEAEGVSQERFYASREALHYFVSVPSFELSGQIQWGRQQELDVKKLLAPATQSFIPLLDATVTNAVFPKVTVQGPVVLLNKAQIQVICSGNRI